MNTKPLFRVTRCYGIYVRETGRLCWDSVANERKTLLKQMRENGLSDREWRKTWVILPVIVTPYRRSNP